MTQPTPFSSLERLNSALASALRSQAAVEGGDLSMDAIRRSIHDSNALLDAAIDCGMSHDEPDHFAWSAIRVAQWLCAA